MSGPRDLPSAVGPVGSEGTLEPRILGVHGCPVHGAPCGSDVKVYAVETAVSGLQHGVVAVILKLVSLRHDPAGLADLPVGEFQVAN